MDDERVPPITPSDEIDDTTSDTAKDLAANWRSADTAPWTACDAIGTRTSVEWLRLAYPRGMPFATWETPHGYQVTVIEVVDTPDHAAVIIDGPTEIVAWRDITLSQLQARIRKLDGFEDIDVVRDDLDWFGAFAY